MGRDYTKPGRSSGQTGDKPRRSQNLTAKAQMFYARDLHGFGTQPGAGGGIELALVGRNEYIHLQCHGAANMQSIHAA
jgi:hypothetical protein